MNFELLKSQYENLLVFKLMNKIPNKDCTNLRKLIRFLKEFYMKCPPEQIDNDFTVIMSDYDFSKNGLDKNKFFDTRKIDLCSTIKFPCVIQIYKNGNIGIWNEQTIDLSQVDLNESISYELKDNEYIWIDNDKNLVEASALNTRSYFSSPTYWDLDVALNNYYLNNAKKSVCSKVANSWTNSKRIRWKNAPESNLRDSLWEYLRATLRGVSEIKREQNVNSENPIDIKVIWNFNFARALIEIKWLGVSVNEDETRKTSDYTNQRAVDGANQLCDYIDASKEENNELHFKGYLVVFDGRRRSVRNLTENQISLADANYYLNKEIVNIPEKFKDYKCSINRFFIEPGIEKRNFSS
ncbi:hypothetical protein SAMN02745163_02506 [Clostridium cavendishii DSM 21758]|uniref:Uncharacterized protein n=1 Tax=Clostridium cavendishii DSM 21758 TaxID=1121302 RepID=A0A1M6LV69_9CLOT|nr:hypothetical protein [Clostridium cavendishii]SHJ75013.1 hypothetical protein SAMN02745163_02506 [Clostridium cavendishii DSM 21758]